ncbi:DUF2147 domain-containing protein [Ichthyenterobacterium sp. W332]|uniref:DUF2147 domain-containing protein n=1 Tax=Microcosmobacter mediterraneus TaxID=3075607 RepID=A0ABU2YM05_9FLAO|nr:DUF2147 domain-containing protein [Ichthyenterobacterium sp. W332]MDT0559191.1 DUF2147 domain-containing protein [Ichthyenterobacterium sp. W332]
MKIISTYFFLICALSLSGQSIFGHWKTIDDKTGEAKSIVEIYEDEGKVFGKIIEILNPKNKNALCKKCEGEDFNKPILGLVIIKDMTKDGDYYKKGTIFDPQEGKEYKCRLLVTKNPDVLQVRGYIAFFYATQYWQRVKS